MTPQEFLDLLWGAKPEDQYVLLWTWPDKRSHWFLDVEKAAEFAAAIGQQKDVYVGVGCSREEYGPGRRCKSEEITGLAGIGTDLDLRSAAHDKPLPGTIAEALTILPDDMQPTIILATGNGIHAWWLFKEPYIFGSDEERAEVMRLLTRWHTMLRRRAAARGWVYDRLSDLARILRIPGTRNLKDPANPKEVVLHSNSGKYYNLSDFDEAVAAIPDPEAEEIAAREWKERFADKPLVINPNARIPQELLDAWMDPSQTDRRIAAMFRNTWERRRHDLKDPSQSGYDLALADFGVDAGLSEQQIVDLIIHHRSIHNKKIRHRLDYFQRTIAKAQERSENRNAIPPVIGAEGKAADSQASAGMTAPPPDCVAPTPPPTPEEEDMRRAALCETISAILMTKAKLPTHILRLVMIDGKDPQYRIELANGKKLEVPSYSKFIDQGSILALLGAATKRRLTRLKPNEWNDVVDKMLAACFEEEGTDDMHWMGAMREQLDHYLAETNFIRAIEEEQRIQDQRKPMVINGRITVIAKEVQTYVNKTTFQNLSVRQVAGALSAMGAKSIRVRGPKFKDQSRWALPNALDHKDEKPGECFDPADYPQTKGESHVTVH